MTLATYPYSDAIREIFASMDEHWRANAIAMYQGRQPDANFYHSWLRQTQLTKEDINGLIDELCQDDEFRKLLLNRHKLKYHKEVSWKFYVANSISPFLEVIPLQYRSWQCVLLYFIYNGYKEGGKQKYPAYYPNNPLELYYRSKGIELSMSSNYGLIDADDFEIKYLNSPKLYDKRFDTHIYLKFIPVKLLEFIAEERKKSPFKLALRPDYEICGDGIKDLMPITEALIRGGKEPLNIDTMPSLSWLCDDATSSDRLIIQHNEKTHEITFEELVGEPEIEKDYIVSQVVHLIYAKKSGSFYINHLDHEYVFYTANQHTEKWVHLTTKGEARQRYKTFKIDDAKILYSPKCSKNIVYLTVDSYFENKDLLKEYFDEMIHQ